MADPITPDMQAAGVDNSQEPMSQGGLLDALRSRGTLPSMLAQNMNQAGPGPSGGLAVGSGMLNAASGGNAALNPYLQQFQAQQNAQVQQSLQYEKLQQENMARKQRQDELAWKMTQDMVDSGDAQAREEGWKNRQKLAGPLGVKIESGVIAGLARGKLSKEQLAQAVGMVDEGMLPEDIGRVTGLPPVLVQQAIQVAGSDGQRRMTGILTRSEAEAGRAKDQQASLDLARNEYGFTDPKDPRIPFMFSYTQRVFGKPFNKATPEEKQEAVDKAEVVAPKPKEAQNAATVKIALAEAGLPADTKDPATIAAAMNTYRGRQQRERLDIAGLTGQLSAVGRQYAAELGRVNQNQDKLNMVDKLVDRMDALITEGRELGLTNNPQLLNAMRQGYWSAVGGPDSKAAQWYRVWDTLDAQFVAVAQAIEGITGNRLAVENSRRALAFHPKRSDPYGTQLRVLGELKKAASLARQSGQDDLSRVLNQYQNAAGAAGVPFILNKSGGPVGHEVESVEEEK